MACCFRMLLEMKRTKYSQMPHEKEKQVRQTCINNLQDLYELE